MKFEDLKLGERYEVLQHDGQWKPATCTSVARRIKPGRGEYGSVSLSIGTSTRFLHSHHPEDMERVRLPQPPAGYAGTATAGYIASLQEIERLQAELKRVRESRERQGRTIAEQCKEIQELRQSIKTITDVVTGRH